MQATCLGAERNVGLGLERGVVVEGDVCSSGNGAGLSVCIRSVSTESELAGGPRDTYAREAAQSEEKDSIEVQPVTTVYATVIASARLAPK